MKILIDPGHGITTPGKQSPDGSLCEWAFNRLLGAEIVRQGLAAGFDCQLLFESDADVPLGERIRLVNAYETASTVLVSVHANAAGNGMDWHSARGFCAFVAPRAGQMSRRLAAELVREARAAGFQGNRAIPAVGYWTANFAICTRTHCPAVLTENLFMDNREDLALMRDPATISALARIHIKAFAAICQ